MLSYFYLIMAAGVVGDHLGIKFGLIGGGVIMISILLTPLAFQRNFS
jgi:hypothetical protein